MFGLILDQKFHFNGLNQNLNVKYFGLTLYPKIAIIQTLILNEQWVI